MIMESSSRRREPHEEVARLAYEAMDEGLSVLPPMQDGSKSPRKIRLGDEWTWAPFQSNPASEKYLEDWYGRERCTGIGLVCGGVSRGLELFEFDRPEAYEQYKELARSAGMGVLVERIEAGYLEETPGDGVHWLYYVGAPKGSTKLARRYKTPEEFTESDHRAIKAAESNGKVHRPIQVLIETKGEGGYVVVAPSFGNVHPSRRPYRLLRGGFRSIVRLSGEERDALWGLARSLDELARPPEATKTPALDEKVPCGVPPWEDFNGRASWEEVLEPHGWTRVYSRGNTTYWRRPGKDEGVSATTGHGGHDCLYVFTSSTTLEQNKGYDKIGAFVALNHGGDFKAAARDLLAKGYGERTRLAVNRDGGGASPGRPGPDGKDGRRGVPAAEQPDPEFAALSDEDLGLVPLRQVECEPIRWLWKYRLGRGALAMMAGDGGIGKSQVLLWIGATVSNGDEWIDGSGRAPKGDVVIVSAEDDPENTIKPRLLAMNADLDRITIVKARYTIRSPGKSPVVHPASFQDRAYWAEVFHRRPNCVLFIADPVPSYLGRGVNDSKNIEIRNILEPFLQEIIQPAGICMLGNTHLNKSADAKTPMHRISGSIAYGALPRNVHFVVRDPDDPLRRVMKQAKCNNAPDDLSALAFRVEQRIITTPRGETIETAVPVFETEGVACDLGEMIAGGGVKNRRGPEPKKTTAVAEAMFDYLRKRREPAPLGAIFDHLGELGLIGQKNEKNRWSNTSIVYQARDLVSELPEPRNGYEVVEMMQPLRHGGREIVHWFLSALGADPDLEEDADIRFGPAPAF